MSTLLAVLYTAATIALHSFLFALVVLGFATAVYFCRTVDRGAQPTKGAIVFLVIAAVGYAAAFIGAYFTL